MKMCHEGFCFVSFSPENKIVFILSNPTLRKLAINPTKHSFLGDCNEIKKGIMIVNNCRINEFIPEEIRNLKVKKKNEIHCYTPTEVTS